MTRGTEGAGGPSPTLTDRRYRGAVQPPPSLDDWLRATASRLAGQPDATLSRRESGAVLALAGDVVIKAHPAGTDTAALARRLRVAATYPALLLPPLADLLPLPGDVGGPGQVASVWRRVEVLAPDTPAAPWAQAATSLAVLHRSPVPDAAAGLTCGAPDRLDRALDRALDRLRALADTGSGPSSARVVLSAGRAVRRALADAGPAAAQTQPRLTHGDWHLGQLGRVDAASPWVMLDVDDLGLGDPAWDLGRPAGFWAAGLLDDASWAGFLDAYRAAGGPAVPAQGDPWPRLDLVARAAVVVAAVRELRAAQPDAESLAVLVEVCGRMPR